MTSAARQTVDDLEGLHLGRGWFMTWLDGLEVVYMDKRLTPESFADYLVVLEHTMKIAHSVRPVLYEVRHPALDPASRRKISALLNEYRDSARRYTLAYALVTPSPTVRGILTALFWMSPPPYPNKVFGTTEKAVGWLSSRVPTLNAERALERYQLARTRLLTRLGPGEFE